MDATDTDLLVEESVFDSVEKHIFLVLFTNDVKSTLVSSDTNIIVAQPLMVCEVLVHVKFEDFVLASH